MEPTSVVYNGKTYRRQPNGTQRTHRVYYWRHDSWKESPQSLHRQIYIDSFGPIPSGMHIHHKDHNPFNNAPSNLQLIEAGRHSSHHMLSPERRQKSAVQASRVRHLTKAWHASPEGLAWHKKHATKQWTNPRRFDRTCEVCGVIFKAFHSTTLRCSGKCHAAAWRRDHPGYYHQQRVG